MKSTVIEVKLTDGSLVYDLIIHEDTKRMTVHCRDYDSAVKLHDMLDELTVDFEHLHRPMSNFSVFDA